MHAVSGRYNQTLICERICFNCTYLVEDKIHVLIVCLVYQNIRAILLEEAISLNEDFSLYDDTEIKCLMSHADIVKYCAKACSYLLVERRNILYH